MNLSLILCVIVSLLVSIMILLLTAIARPAICDKILAVNSFGTNMLALIVLVAFFTEQMMMLDVAIIYASVNFIATIALTKFFSKSN